MGKIIREQERKRKRKRKDIFKLKSMPLYELEMVLPNACKVVVSIWRFSPFIYVIILVA